MDLKKFAGTATIAGALGAAALGIGSGVALADSHDHGPGNPGNPGNPGPVPADTDFSQPPGHIGQDLGVPPGQLKQQPQLEVALDDGTLVDIDNPFYGVPPGHWDDVDFQGAVDDAIEDLPVDEVPDVPQVEVVTP